LYIAEKAAAEALISKQEAEQAIFKAKNSEKMIIWLNKQLTAIQVKSGAPIPHDHKGQSTGIRLMPDAQTPVPQSQKQGDIVTPHIPRPTLSHCVSSTETSPPQHCSSTSLKGEQKDSPSVSPLSSAKSQEKVQEKRNGQTNILKTKATRASPLGCAK
jgi:hypothetical protein